MTIDVEPRGAGAPAASPGFTRPSAAAFALEARRRGARGKRIIRAAPVGAPAMNAFARSTFPVVNVLGYVVMIFAFTMLVPLLFAWIGDDRALAGDGQAMLLTADAFWRR